MTTQEQVRVLDAGTGVYRPPDPDGFRRHVRDQKERRLVSKVMTEQEAVERFVRDGDYLAYDCNMARRGPSSLLREIIRQRRRDLWVAAKFTSNDVDLLIAGGCVSKVDVGWMQVSRPLTEALAAGTVEMFEWTNGALAYRLQAGAMGVPFLPLRYVGGTDVFRQSGTKLIEDPYTGKPICLVPALNPDVSILHAYQCDEYGNARIYGPGIQPLETALAAKRVIISTEEIIDNAEIRREPSKTMIPYYAVDAVVEAPFGSYPGAMPGMYAADLQHVAEFGMAMRAGRTDEYLERYVHSVESHREMLDQRVGATRLLELRRQEVKHREGYDL